MLSIVLWAILNGHLVHRVLQVEALQPDILPHMGDSSKENGFKLRNMVDPFHRTRKSSGMGDGRVLMWRMVLPRKPSRIEVV